MTVEWAEAGSTATAAVIAPFRRPIDQNVEPNRSSSFRRVLPNARRIKSGQVARRSPSAPLTKLSQRATIPAIEAVAQLVEQRTFKRFLPFSRFLGKHRFAREITVFFSLSAVRLKPV
jgi:hypothetical protein